MAIHTTFEKFDEQVIQPSEKIPVIVDFWAAWCNPCKIIGPILEKLEKEYDGKFILAKVDTEAEQKLSVQYQVTSIPTVLLFYQKDVADRIVGALPEESIKLFIENNLPDPVIVAAQQMVSDEKYEKAGLSLVSENIKGAASSKILWQCAIELLKLETPNLDSIISMLDAIDKYGSEYSEPKIPLIDYLKNADGVENVSVLTKVLHVETATNVLEEVFAKFENAAGESKKGYQSTLLILFHLLGSDSPLALEYRKKLSRALN